MQRDGCIAKCAEESDGEPEDDGGGTFHRGAFFVAASNSRNAQLRQRCINHNFPKTPTPCRRTSASLLCRRQRRRTWTAGAVAAAAAAAVTAGSVALVNVVDSDEPSTPAAAEPSSVAVIRVALPFGVESTSPPLLVTPASAASTIDKTCCAV